MVILHSFNTIALFSIVIHLFSIVPLTQAAPTSPRSLLTLPFIPTHHDLTASDTTAITHSLTRRQPEHHHLVRLLPRAKYTLVKNSTGDLIALGETMTPLPQGIASDGAGVDYDAPAILWIGYCFLLGTPIMLAGMRVGRAATGVAIGLTASLLSWASIVNSLGPSTLNDLVIQLVVFGFCLCGLLVGALRFGMYIGMVFLGILGGLSVGVRVVIMKQGLLAAGEGGYAANWALVVIVGVIPGFLVVWKRTQRWTLAFGCSSVGTFLTFLALDLVVNKQAGMSRGLRYLFDRNSSHIVDIITTGYNPPVTTQVLLGISIALTPLFTYGQHRFFTNPFLPPSSKSSYPDPTMGTYVSSESDADSINNPRLSQYNSKPDSEKPSGGTALAGWFRRDPKPAPGRPSAAAAGAEKTMKLSSRNRKSTNTIATFLDSTIRPRKKEAQS